MNQQPSLIIKMFTDFILQAESEYKFCYDKVRECDRQTQDILHEIELGEYSGRDRAATKLHHVRKDRRAYKDVVESLQPFIDFLSTQEGKRLKNQLPQVLGQVRKQESYHENRTYAPKELKIIDTHLI